MDRVMHLKALGLLQVFEKSTGCALLSSLFDDSNFQVTDLHQTY